MSRSDRLSEDKQRHFLSFEKDFKDDLTKAKTYLSAITSENEGQILKKTYLQEWIDKKEAPLTQKKFQERQIEIASEANNIAKLALLVSVFALFISLVT